MVESKSDDDALNFNAHSELSCSVRSLMPLENFCRSECRVSSIAAAVRSLLTKLRCPARIFQPARAAPGRCAPSEMQAKHPFQLVLDGRVCERHPTTTRLSRASHVRGLL
jgi:hypothetical protein